MKDAIFFNNLINFLLAYLSLISYIYLSFKNWKNGLVC